MKHIRCLSIYFVLLFIFVLNNGNLVFGQEKFNISGGFGVTDLLNIGTRYQLKKDTLQLGISIGTGFDGFKSFSISSDVYYNFGGFSKFSSRPPWYLKGGIDILYSSYPWDHESIYWAITGNLRLGRDFNISKRVGLNFEAGLGYSPVIDIGFYKLYPSFGLYFFYRI